MNDDAKPVDRDTVGYVEESIPVLTEIGTGTRVLRGLLLPVTLLVYWWALFADGTYDAKLIVPISKVVETGVEMAVSGKLWAAISTSVLRNLTGLAIGGAAGLVLGALLGLSRWARQIVGPTLHTVKQISLFAWIPLIMVWFGLGETSKIVFVSLSAFFPVVLNVLEGVAGAPRELVEVAKVLRFSRWQLLSRVVLPAALPSIFTGLYLALIYSWLATLGAEYLLTSGEGLGSLLSEAREHFWIDQVLLGIAVVGTIGFALTWIASRIEAHLLRWRGSSTAQY